MLNGASQIINGVSGVHLDPLLLAQSQDGEAVGFIMVAHEVPQKSFDILFIHGPSIVECARMTADSRFPIDVESVRSAFLINRRTSLVYLFLCPVHEIERFVATLHAEPCLKVHVNAISRRQIRSLIKATGCRNGIVERNIFQTSPPRIELVEIDAQGNLPALKTGLSAGRLLLYDLDKSNDFKIKVPISSIPSLRTRQRKGGILITKQRSADTQSPEESHTEQRSDPSPNLELVKSEIDEIDEMIKQILSSSPSSDSQKGSLSHPVKKTRRKQPDQHNDSATHSNEGKDEIPPISTNDNPKDNGNTTPPREVATASEPPKPSSVGDDGQKYIKVFQRLFRSFRQQAFECFGPRYEAVMSHAEQQVRLLAPEFDMENLTEDVVPLILDIIEDMINRAPFLKRSKLREAAKVLVADLYNKHYELLEQHNAIDKVEQNYFQLKK